MDGCWAILQLREGLDPVPVTELERDLRIRWSRAVLKFPAIKQGQLDRDNPLSSYVFVRTPVSPQLEKSPYVSRFLRDPVTRKLQKVTDAELAEMTPLPELPPPGTPVIVTAGDWAGMEGVCAEVNCSSVKVLVELWSRKAVLTLTPAEFQTV